jgi:hypothetical protein
VDNEGPSGTTDISAPPTTLFIHTGNDGHVRDREQIEIEQPRSPLIVETPVNIEPDKEGFTKAERPQTLVTTSHAATPADGETLTEDEVLDAAEAFLGAGYTEPDPGSGRFVSADGTRVVRLGEGDITGQHPPGPHVNFEELEQNSQTGRMKVISNKHVNIT